MIHVLVAVPAEPAELGLELVDVDALALEGVSLEHAIVDEERGLPREERGEAPTPQHDARDDDEPDEPDEAPDAPDPDEE